MAILLHFNIHYFSLNWEMKPEIISVDVVKCWVFKEEHWQGLYGSHNAMLSILLHHLGPACLTSDFVKLHPHWQRRKKQQSKPEVKGQHALRILMIICLIQVSARAMWFYGNLFVRHIISQYMGKHEFGPFLTIPAIYSGQRTEWKPFFVPYQYQDTKADT